MSITIEEFYSSNKLDPEFDHKKYLQDNPEVDGFYKDHCRQLNIGDKHRFYFHYILYGQHTNVLSENCKKLYAQKDHSKFIYLKPTNGLANRLFCISSFLDFAKKFHFNKTYVCWKESQGFSYEKFADLFDIEMSLDQNNIEFISEEVYNDACDKHFVLDESINQDHYTLEYSFKYDKYDIIQHITNNTFCYSWFSSIHYFLPGIIKPTHDFIKGLRVSDLVMSRLLTRLSGEIPQNSVGVHIRRGDAIKTPYGYEYHRSSDQSFINTINNSTSKTFFLATDCKKTQNKVIKSCPNKKFVVYNKEFNSIDLKETDNKPNQLDAVAEMFLLSQTKEVLGTRFSTFGMLASEISSIPFTEVTVDQTYYLSNISLPPISLVIGVKNRFDILKVCLQSWVNQKAIKEIVVIDWDSSDINKKYLKKLDRRIKIVSFKKKNKYHISRVINEGIKYCKYEHIIKCDVDYIANPYYQLEQWLDLDWETEFMTGSWTQKTLDNDAGFMQYLNGLMICKKKHIQDAGMYDERYTEYGWEDSDLHERLIKKLNLVQKIIPNSRNFFPVYHNPHMDYKRTEYYTNKDPEKSTQQNRIK